MDFNIDDFNIDTELPDFAADFDTLPPLELPDFDIPLEVSLTFPDIDFTLPEADTEL